MSALGRDVRVIHDGALERWEVGFVDALGTTFLVGDGPVRLGRDGSGAVAEYVIDAAVVDTDSLTMIRAAFGDPVADLVASLGTDDVDLVISDARPAPGTSPASVPVRVDDGRYAVATAVGEVEVRVTRGVLRFRLPGATGTEGLWVRVASADSGALLGLAPVVDDPAGGSAVAEAVFGLDVDPSSLTISVSSDPLRGDPRPSEEGSWPRPGRTVVETGRRRRRRTTGVVVAVAVVLGVVLLVTGGASVEDSPSATTSTTTAVATTTTVTATTTTVFVDPGPGDPGPASFEYPDGDRVTVAVEGAAPTVSPGSSVPIVVGLTTAAYVGYGPAPGETVAPEDLVAAEERARETCLNVRDQDVRGVWNLPPAAMSVRLVRIVPEPPPGMDPERLVLGRFDLVGEPVSSTTDEESCRAATLTASGFNALTFVRRAPQTVEFAIPVGTAPGLWEVTVDLDGEAGVVDGRLRLRIEPAAQPSQ
ncbi:MAG: hypothetical protein RIR49_1375 [Actinomycetota bacterium]|jgi:hypothetical protein